MKTKIYVLWVLLSLLSIPVTAQEKTKKELKAERTIQKQKEIQSLIESVNFVFNAEKLIPQGGGLRILDYNIYFVKFSTENAVGDLPFFGRAFNIPYGGDGGIKFEGKPEKIKIEKKKKSYIVKATVKGKDDIYDLMFSVFFDGGTTLSVNSNKRASISYDGNITAPKTELKKE